MAAARSSETEEQVTTGYGGQILNNMKEFHDSELLCDFKLIVEGEAFKVHRLVLASASDYFRAMFTHNMMESRKNYLELKGLTSAGVRPLIKYAYTGKLHLNMSNIQDILAVSTFLQMTSAVDLCCTYLKSKLGFENAEEIVKLGDMFGLTNMKKFYKRYVLDNFLEFAETDMFLKLDAKVVADYLLEDSLRTSTEAKLCKVIIKWYNHDKKSRENDIFDVLEKVRYTNDGWPLIEFARTQEPFVSNKDCERLLQTSEQYMQKPERNHLEQNYRTRVRYDRSTLVQVGGEQEFDYEYFVEPYFNMALAGQRGGTQHNHFYHLDCTSWFPLGVVAISEARSHCVIVEVNNYGILIGGYIYNNYGETVEKHITNEVKLLTPGGSTGKDFALWDMQYMQVERAHHAAASIPGYLFVIGGKKDDQHVRRCVEMFDLDRERWMFVRSLNKPLYDHAAAGYKVKVYVSGGVESCSVVSTVYCYDPLKDRWENRAPMLAARAGHTMTVFDKRIIVCGGRIAVEASNTRCLSSVESYDPETNQWTFLAPMRYDCAYMGAVVLDGSLIVAGGENSGSGLLHVVQEYNPKTNKWGMFTYLPKPMKNIGLCSLTIKLNCETEEDDSVRDAFDAMYLPDDDYYDDYAEYADWEENSVSTDDLEM